MDCRQPLEFESLLGRHLLVWVPPVVATTQYETTRCRTFCECSDRLLDCKVLLKAQAAASYSCDKQWSRNLRAWQCTLWQRSLAVNFCVPVDG